MHTTDGGRTWHDHDLQTNDYFHSIYFPDSLNGWVTASRGKVYHTTDAGTTWVVEQVDDSSPWLTEIFFVSDSVGWLVGSLSTYEVVILKTYDAGSSWVRVGEDLRGGPLGVYFVSEDEGWVVGGKSLFDNFGDPVIWHTSDGGESWEEQEAPLPYGPLIKVFFWDSVWGWAVGMNERVIRTFDGGLNWWLVDVQLGDTVINCCFFDVTMTDINNVWINHLYYVYHSKDGGEEWEIEWDWGLTVQPLSFPEMHFIDSSRGWAVGGNLVLGYSESGLSTSEDGDMGLPEGFSLAKPYPNPFNPITTIQYDLPRACHVSLTIYDLMGREVKVAVSKWGRRQGGIV